MSDFGFSSKLKLSHKCVILTVMTMCFVFAFIPLWQVGINNSLRTDLYLSSENIVKMDAEDRALRAAIAEVETAESYSYFTANADF